VQYSITVKNNLIKIQEMQQLYASRLNSLVSPLGICSYCLVFTSISYMTSVKWSYLKLKCFTLWLIKYICIVPYLFDLGPANPFSFATYHMIEQRIISRFDLCSMAGSGGCSDQIDLLEDSGKVSR